MGATRAICPHVYTTQGWLPAEASAVAEKWQLPAARVKLGAPYAQVRGDARLVWREGAFDLSLNARAEPAAKTKAPPFEANATAHGNLREVTLTALHVDAPFGTARLSAPVTFSIDRPVSAESAPAYRAGRSGQTPLRIEARMVKSAARSQWPVTPPRPTKLLRSSSATSGRAISPLNQEKPAAYWRGPTWS